MSILDQFGIDLAQIGGKGSMLAWWMVRNTLLERVRSKGHLVKLHMGYTLQGIVDEPSAPHVKATFVPSADKLEDIAETKIEDAQPETLTLEGCLIVGADGVHSSVRTFLNLPPAQKVGTSHWRGSFVLDPKNPLTSNPGDFEVLMGLLDKGILPLGGFRAFGPTTMGVFNFNSKVPGRIIWSVSAKSTNIPPKTHPWEFALEPYVEDENDRKVIQALFRVSSPDDLYYTSEFCTIELPEEDGNGWGGKGRVMLIGDAAHAMRASSGQGGSMAFEDAVVLYRAIRNVETADVDKYDNMSDLVLRVENERLERVRRVWQVEHLLAVGLYGIDPTKEGNPWTPEHVSWLHEGV